MERPRSLIALGATALLVGIGFAASGDSLVGAGLVLPSLIVLVYGLHRFGRSGPDEPMTFEPPEN